jgi:hypothetical protein
VSKRYLKSGDCDDHFLRAFYDALADVKTGLLIETEVKLEATGRKGVFYIILTAKMPELGSNGRALCVYQTEYPNSHAQLMSAALFQASIRYVQLIEATLEGIADEIGRTRRSSCPRA